MMATKSRHHAGVTGRVPTRESVEYEEEEELESPIVDEKIYHTKRASSKSKVAVAPVYAHAPQAVRASSKSRYQRYLESEKFDKHMTAELWNRLAKAVYGDGDHVDYEKHVVPYELQQTRTDDPDALALIATLYPASPDAAGNDETIIVQWSLQHLEGGPKVKHYDVPIDFKLMGQAGVAHKVVVSASTTYPDSSLAVQHITLPTNRRSADENDARFGFMNSEVNVSTAPPNPEPLELAMVVFDKHASVTERVIKDQFGTTVHSVVRPSLQSVLAKSELKADAVTVRIRGFPLVKQHGIIQCLVKFQHAIYPVMAIDFVFLFTVIAQIWEKHRDLVASKSLAPTGLGDTTDHFAALLEICNSATAYTPIEHEDAVFICDLLSLLGIECVVGVENLRQLQAQLTLISQSVFDDARATVWRLKKRNPDDPRCPNNDGLDQWITHTKSNYHLDVPKYVFARCIQELLKEINQTTRLIHPRKRDLVRLVRVDGQSFVRAPYHVTLQITANIEPKSDAETEPSVENAFAIAEAQQDPHFHWAGQPAL